MKRSLAVFFLIVAAALARADDEKRYELTKESLEGLVKELQPLVEKEIGKKFSKPPTIELSDAETVEEILYRELKPQMTLYQPAATKEQLRALAKSQASLYAAMLLAKYAPAQDKIFVLADNFPKLAELTKNPRLLTREWARATVLHELVHASDQDGYKLFDLIKSRKTREELEALNAVAEGHAQHVTHRILAASQEEKLFLAFRDQITAIPPGTSEGDKYLAGILSYGVKFSYVDGEAFFTALASEDGHPDYASDVLTRPPTKKSTIRKPATYYKPEPEQPKPDLASLWKKLEEARAEEWSSQRVSLDAAGLMAGFGDLIDSKRASEVLDDMRFCDVVVFAPKDAPGSKQVSLVVWAGSDEKAAARFFDLDLELSKAKDEHMKEGTVVIKKSTYGTLELKKATRNALVDKTFTVGTEKGKIRFGLVEYKSYVLELNHVADKVGDEELVKEAETIMEFLDGLK